VSGAPDTNSTLRTSCQLVGQLVRILEFGHYSTFRVFVEPHSPDPPRGLPWNQLARTNDDDNLVSRRTRSVRLLLGYIDSTPLQTCTVMASAVLHSSVLVYQFDSVLFCFETASFGLQFGDWPFVKYSAARTVQFEICRPASPVRLHYPRFSTQYNIFLLTD
jgi:hypothetical protein